MCGIAGVIHPEPEPERLHSVLPYLQAALRHRGPDDTGSYVSPDGRCGFAHARLAILDLSPAGHQPMFSRDGRYAMVFNGEIYNFRALAQRLEAEGHRLVSQSDTEVVLLLYQLLGPACVNEFGGMFALAIWDLQERTCFLARDALGIKPLYYAHRGDGALAFASELRALLTTGIVAKRLDASGLMGYFMRGSVAEPRTLIEGAHCLEAGHWMLWKDGKVRSERFWTLPIGRGGADDPIPAGEDIAFVRRALLDSVEHHFVSDVPVGLFLSGGIDSTALVALARAQGRENLRTYSISFDEAEFNEGESAQRTADHFRTRHEDFRLTGTAARELFQQFLMRLDQPSVDGFNTYAISKVAHEHGAKVVLSGLGGDEIFGSFPSFSGIPRMLELARKLGGFRNLAGECLRHWPGHPRFRRVGDFLTGPVSLERAMTSYRGIYTEAEAATLTAHYLDGRRDLPPLTGRVAVGGEVPRAGLKDAISALEITGYMRNQLLRDSDVASMAWGLELRVPLVDRFLYEALARVSPERRLRPGKAMLLEAVPEIPEWVAHGAKRGFSFPFERWLEHDWKGLFGENVTDVAGVHPRTWYQRWCIYVFRRWWEM